MDDEPFHLTSSQVGIASRPNQSNTGDTLSGIVANTCSVNAHERIAHSPISMPIRGSMSCRVCSLPPRRCRASSTTIRRRSWSPWPCGTAASSSPSGAELADAAQSACAALSPAMPAPTMTTSASITTSSGRVRVDVHSPPHSHGEACSTLDFACRIAASGGFSRGTMRSQHGLLDIAVGTLLTHLVSSTANATGTGGVIAASSGNY
jgi:hypothetical protein